MKDKQPAVILPNKTDAEKSYNNKLLSDKETLVSFLKSNEIRGWPTTNRDVFNPNNSGNSNANYHSSYLKFWESSHLIG